VDLNSEDEFGCPTRRSYAWVFAFCNSLLKSIVQTNSILTRRPTIAAIRCRLESVMSHFGFNSRPTHVRLVFSTVAIPTFQTFKTPVLELLNFCALRLFSSWSTAVSFLSFRPVLLALRDAYNKL